MDYEDTADLLGNREMPIVRPQQSGSGSFFSLGNAVLPVIITVSIAVLLRFVFSDIYIWIRRWNDQSTKLAWRRKYGIPDSDKRPFNVAYSEVVRKQEEKKRQQAQRPRPIQPPIAEAGPSKTNQIAHNANDSSSAPEGIGKTVNHKPVLSDNQNRGFLRQPTQSSRVHVRDFAHDDEVAHSPVFARPPAFTRARGESAVDTGVSAPHPSSNRKRGEVTGDLKGKARNEAKEVIDVDAEDSMDVAEADGLPDASDRRAKRGFKRQAGQEEDGNSSSSPKKAGKRARRQSRKIRDFEAGAKVETVSGDGEGEEQSMDLDLSTSSARGKKRDRAEAGSTFGGDDESPLGHGRKNRRRKRKSIATIVEDGSIDSWSRGTKRSHDLESTMDSDDEHHPRSKISRKRGKRATMEPNDSSDVSMDDIRAVRDPACRGRRIGDEWEINGEKYKVGQDGRRLRQVLVKKRKSRYSMPADSSHPDSQAQITFCVEKWLNDEQYKEAEERGDIYFPIKPDTGEDEVQDATPEKIGKPLLWSPRKSTTRFPRLAFKDSIVTNIGLNINPFERPAEAYTRRISTGHIALRQTIGIGSPGLRQSKSYSKWEKQDLEAEAMAKLRKKLEEEKKASMATLKQEKKVTFELPSSMTPSAPSLTSSISAPASTNTPVMAKKDVESIPTGINFAPPVRAGTSTSTAQIPTISIVPPTREPSSSSDQTKTPPFSLTPQQPPKQPSPAPVPSPAPPVQSPFGQPPSASQSGTNGTNQKPAGTPIPSFFSKPADTSTSAAPTAAPTFTSGPKPATFPRPDTTPSNSTAFNIKGAAAPTQSDKIQSSSGPVPSFGAPKPEGQQQGGNLFGRIGGFANSTPSGTSGYGSGASSSPFSFAQPKQAETKQSGVNAGDVNKGATPAVSATPKFNFGSTAKPTVPLQFQSTAPATTNTNMETAKSSAPATTPMFKFNVTPPSQPATSSGSANAMEVKPPSGVAFSVRPAATPNVAPGPTVMTPAAAPQQPSSNAFGTAAGPTNTTASAAPNPSTAPKFAFNFGSQGTSNASNPFGGASAPNPFGAPAASKLSTSPTPSPFSVAPSTGNTAPTEAPKSIFGSTSTPGATTTFTAASSAPAENKDNKTNFAFKFGANPSGSAQIPVFGSTTTQSAGTTNTTVPNGFGTTNTSSPFAFGQGSSGNAASSANSNVFGAKPAGPTPMAFGSNNAASPSPFGNSGAFTFGSQQSNTSTQK